jgi:hypothetical protein
MDSKEKQDAAPDEERDDAVEAGEDEESSLEQEEGEQEEDEAATTAAAPVAASGTGSSFMAFFNRHYRSVDPRWLGLFRIGFGILLITELMYRWSYARMLFSNDGLLPNHFSLFAPMGQDLFSIYHVFSTIGEVHVAFALTLVVFLCFTLGYKTRLFHVLSAILITSLHSRNLFTENGGSVVTHSLATWTVFLPVLLDRRLTPLAFGAARAQLGRAQPARHSPRSAVRFDRGVRAAAAVERDLLLQLRAQERRGVARQQRHLLVLVSRPHRYRPGRMGAGARAHGRVPGSDA